MTISSTTVKNSYSGNGTLDTFNYTFRIFADSDLQVIIRDASATETVKTLTTHYTVTGAGSASGGTIVFTAGNIPTATETVVIRRALPQTQSIDYIANDPFPAESHEEGLDRSMMAIQQLQEEIDRSIKLSRTNTMNSTEFTIGDTDRANKVFGFDASGELTVAQELGTFKGNWSSGTTFAVRDIIKDTSNNNVYICLTAHTSSGSQPISTNADVAKWGLLVDAASATTSATAAAASASAAATSESNAATSESNAATSETNSANSATASANSATSSASSATASANSATAAAASASAAEATFDLFDDSYLGAKASNPTVDNDGDALQDGALYFDTTNDVMKVYNLANTTWYQLTPTVSNQTNINTVAGISSDVTSVANISSDVTATANNNTNITTVAGQITPTNNVSTLAGVSSSISTLSPISSNITTVAGISGDVTSVSNISTAVSNVNSNSANINTVATDLAGSDNIGTVAGSIANVNLTGGSIANVNEVADNIGTVNEFGERYRVSATAPTTSLDVGDLYYDTTTDTMKVYGTSGWQNAGSSVNGTSQRYNYTATSGQTTFTGADNNGNTLTYDAGYIDVYLNGVKLLNGTDVTVTSGSSVVLASGATTGDVVDIVAYGTFSVASLNADNLTSGTVPDARITGTYTGITGLDLTDNSKIRLGTGNDLEIYHDGSNSFISDEGTGLLAFTTNGTAIQLNSAGEQMGAFNQNGSVDLFYDNSKKIETTSTGALVTGRLSTSAGNASEPNFNFSADGNTGIYRASQDVIAFSNNGSESMRIDSSGNVLVGKTSSSTATEGIELRASNLTTLTRSGNNVLTVNRLSNDGSLINLTKNSSTVGTISARFGGIQIGNSDTGLLFNDGSNEINPTNADGGINDNLTILGTNNRRFKDLYLGGGVYLGGTGTANHLDDYEEGTWTPTTNIGYANIYYAFYVKIGRLVFAHMYVQTNAGPGDTSQATAVSGLPFSAISGDVISNSNIIQGFNQDVYCEIGGSSFAQRDRSDNVLITRGEYGNKYQKCTIVYYTDA
jgi:hypothetical protein